MDKELRKGLNEMPRKLSKAINALAGAIVKHQKKRLAPQGDVAVQTRLELNSLTALSELQLGITALIQHKIMKSNKRLQKKIEKETKKSDKNGK